MNIVKIESLKEPGIEMFGSLTEAQLRNRAAPEEGVFIAESPKVIRVALDAGMQPLALLCESRHIAGDAADIIARCPEMPVYTGGRQLLAQLTGYTLTRGVLCAMRRPLPRSVAEVCEEARRIVVIHSVCDTTNIGAIFRSAAALGIDAVLLTEDSCDPLNRRSIRVSMGSVFLVPWTWIDDLSALRGLGFGLPHSTILEADYTVRIPMYHQVDSLNVAAAAAVAFWELRASGLHPLTPSPTGEGGA